jgi:radical SAM enzyme (TIGR01210 family)
LWRNTLTETVPAGSIPAQIEFAQQRLAPAREIKLYNSGSFFDVRAIPNEDHGAIAALVGGFDRIIVECHPALVGDDCRRFKERLNGRLEVAMGLETAHPDVLARLNKRMTIEQFSAASAFLRREGIDLRVFILVKPPFMADGEALEWANRSLDFAFDCGATAAILIPTRGGNGALEELAASGEFSPPRLHALESAMAYGLSMGRGRVFVDLWDMPVAGACTQCLTMRVARLRAMNLQQLVLPPVSCESCEVEH